MGWWLLIFGIVILAGGIILKIKEYEDFGDYKDFQNLTTKTRYLKDETNKFNKNQNRKIEGNNGKSGNSIDKVIEDASNKEKQLRRINNELDEIITEIHSKEARIKNILEKSKKEDKEDMEIKDKKNFKKMLKNSTEKIEGKELPEKHRKIFELYNQGHKEEEIANKLNIGIRETSLIIKMHRRGAAND